MAAQTTLKITYRSGAEVRVYLTLSSGAVTGCEQDVNAVSLVTNPVNRLQGWFLLPDGADQGVCAARGAGRQLRLWLAAAELPNWNNTGMAST